MKIGKGLDKGLYRWFKKVSCIDLNAESVKHYDVYTLIMLYYIHHYL